MGVLYFIHANAAMLLVACALLFVAGLVLYLVGKALQHKGERLMAEAQYARPYAEPEDVQEWGTFDEAEYATPIYPPA